MKAIVIRDNFKDYPLDQEENKGVAEVISLTNQVLLTVGKEYEVHAVVVSRGLVRFQVVHDLGDPMSYPAWLFKISDMGLPDDWICNQFYTQPSLVIGPPQIAESLESYVDLQEGIPQARKRFWERVNNLPKDK